MSCECTILTGTILTFDWPYSLPLQVPYLFSFFKKRKDMKIYFKTTLWRKCGWSRYWTWNIHV